MPESNDPPPTSKTEETIPPSFLHECRQFLHTATNKLETINETIKEWTETKENGVDVTARALALFAILGVIAVGVTVARQGEISQKQEMNLERPRTLEESAADWVEQHTPSPLEQEP